MNRRVRTGVAVYLLASLASCSGGGRADTKERVATFEAKLSKELGTEVKLECPTMIDQHYHYCTAVVVGEEDLAFPVRVKSRGNELEYTTKRWVTGANMVRLGKHALTKKLDIAVDSLTCPKVSHMPDGAKVRCEATAEGIEIPVEVSMVIKVRKLHFEPLGGVVFGRDAARVAHEKLGEDGVYTEVKCSHMLVVSVPGKRFECEAMLPDETTRTIHFLITSENGDFVFGTEPPSGDDGEAKPATSAEPVGSAAPANSAR